mgnify:CR=1
MWKFCDKIKLCNEHCLQWEVLRDNIEVIDKAIQESGWIVPVWYLCKTCRIKGSVRINTKIYWHYVIWLILIFLRRVLWFLWSFHEIWINSWGSRIASYCKIWNSLCIQACLFLERPQNLYALKAGFVWEKIRSSNIHARLSHVVIWSPKYIHASFWRAYESVLHDIE